jgi:hypothetical protein
MDLDDIINSAIELAQNNGYPLQQLRDRVQERLLARVPDRVLVVLGYQPWAAFKPQEDIGVW